MIQNHIIIFNPSAGKGAALKKLPLVESFFKKEKINYTIKYTEGSGHAIDLAASFASVPDVAVIAAGGDGTCNEVLNGLMKGRGDKIPLFGVLPMGRGNDFSYGGHVPARLDEALHVLKSGNSSPLDLGLVKGGDYPGGRYFGNGIGIGFDTVVGLEAAKMKHVHDAFAYIAGTMKTLIKFSGSPEVEMVYGDKKIVRRVIQISLMNGRRMGGLFYMAPDAVNNDGMLDLCMVDHLTRFKLMKTIFHYTKGTQRGLEGITMDRADHFHIKALDGGLVVHADGETVCIDGRELEVSCIPGPLRIIHT
ncbi:diacylglycerol/lipid kinase family protein [Spirochaeta isovalerica]|uniref:YegS/Rv2252/BmrU family lipid kinase n=1 Tax=Spirochaeta isovalerica TaxID=150 RepID=A0A841R956_9SPIO|nr:diacylglycerol kinase family protein [Spirochaeta isovalerica]MBB6481844.1 YegS/Rv2252/BmrU family lipid kinase [Spirochaeta isovalerica]